MDYLTTNNTTEGTDLIYWNYVSQDLSLSLIVFRRREKNWKKSISYESKVFDTKERQIMNEDFFTAYTPINDVKAFVFKPLFNIVISSVQKPKRKEKSVYFI